MIACFELTDPGAWLRAIRKMRLTRSTWLHTVPQCEVTGSWSISKSLDGRVQTLRHCAEEIWCINKKAKIHCQTVHIKTLGERSTRSPNEKMKK